MTTNWERMSKVCKPISNLVPFHVNVPKLNVPTPLKQSPNGKIHRLIGVRARTTPFPQRATVKAESVSKMRRLNPYPMLTPTPFASPKALPSTLCNSRPYYKRV